MTLKKITTAAACAAVIAAAPAHAVLGVGDVSFDPQTYAQLVQMMEQMEKAYTVATKQLDRLVQIQDAIREAERTYDDVVNTDLDAMAKSLKPSKGLGADRDKLQRLRDELERSKNGAGANVGYIKYQMERIDNLLKLSDLQEAGGRNLSKASTNLGDRDSARVTAQSTAALAALATLREQRDTEERMAHARAAQEDTDLVRNSGKLFGAFSNGNGGRR